MAKVLVTGASGFIGKHLVPKLCDIQHDVIEVTRVVGDIADETVWSQLQHADIVVHLAGRTFIPDSWADPTSFIDTNLYGTVAALNYCRKHRARLVFLSSYLYGKPEKLPTPESAALKVNNPYMLSKKLAEEVCEFYAKFFGVKITILRPFNIYGPGQSDNFLIPSIIHQVKMDNAICVKDLEPKRDYVYIDDLVDAIVKAVDLDQSFNVFNIGMGVSYSVEELINLIQQIKGTNLPIQSGAERRPEEVMDTQADITQAMTILGWSPKWTLKAGLQKMLAR